MKKSGNRGYCIDVREPCKMTKKKKCRNYYLVFFFSLFCATIPLAKNISRRFLITKLIARGVFPPRLGSRHLHLVLVAGWFFLLSHLSSLVNIMILPAVFNYVLLNKIIYFIANHSRRTLCDEPIRF